MASLVVALVLSVSPAMAEDGPPQCGPRPQVMDILTDGYGEGTRATGMAADGSMMELLAAPTGTWSLTVTLPDGTTCLVASGTAFETVDEPAPPGIPS